MLKITRIALLFVVLAVGFVSTAPTQGIGAQTPAPGPPLPKPTIIPGCKQILECIPEMVFDFKTCRCVARP
jgi:hypothetical protein